MFSAQGGYLQYPWRGGSDGASYCEPKKIHDPEILHQKNTWHQNFLPPQKTRPSTSIPIYSIRQTLDLKIYVTDLLTPKNSEGVNRQAPKIRRTSPSCILQAPHPPLGFSDTWRLFLWNLLFLRKGFDSLDSFHLRNKMLLLRYQQEVKIMKKFLFRLIVF